MATLPFLILPELLAKGEIFYEGLENVNEGVPEAKDPLNRPLRVRDPWG